MKTLFCLLLYGAVSLSGCRALLDYAGLDAGCAEQKIAFTQQKGCVSDDSFEFCIPAGDPQALAQVHAIAPDALCGTMRGRAGCDLQTQLLCMVHTEGLCYPDQPEAMTLAGWQMTCDLAALPFVETIVATWYE
jgi:hypothetical protein